MKSIAILRRSQKTPKIPKKHLKSQKNHTTIWGFRIKTCFQKRVFLDINSLKSPIYLACSLKICVVKGSWVEGVGRGCGFRGRGSGVWVRVAGWVVGLLGIGFWFWGFVVAWVVGLGGREGRRIRGFGLRVE